MKILILIVLLTVTWSSSLMAAQWSIVHGPFSSVSDANHTKKYLRNISELPIELWEHKGDYYLFVGRFNTVGEADIAFKETLEAGYEDILLQQRALKYGKMLSQDVVIPTDPDVVQERINPSDSMIVRETYRVPVADIEKKLSSYIGRYSITVQRNGR